MIVVRVELHHAKKPGKVTELARMEIFNDETGEDDGNGTWHNYGARTLFGRGKEQLDRRRFHRQGELKHWPSERYHVWFLVAAVLRNLGYDRTTRQDAVEAAAIARGNEEGLIGL